MLLKNDFFNKNAVSIFTDASLTKVNGVVSVCPGYCVYIGNVLVEQGYDILHNTTINRGELSAIMMGVMAAVKYRDQYSKIRLFSDSQTSIFAIRDRIFKWINHMQEAEGTVLCGVDGKPIQNIELIMNVIYYVIQTNLNIEFYHVKGHIKVYDYYDLQRAKSVFQKSNFINDAIDDEFIRHIVIGNDQVDQYTGIMLNMHVLDEIYNNLQKPLVSIAYAPFDTKQYQSLIGKG